MPQFRKVMMRVFLLLMMISFTGFELGCEKTVEDVRAWAKDRRRERKMKEFIQGDNSDEVKVEAIVVLIERNKAVNLEPILAELPEGDRQRLISKTIPRVEALANSERQHDQLVAKDGAYWLLQLEPPPPEEDAAKLRQIMLTWIDSENFWRPDDSAGTVLKKQIFEQLGAEGIPVLERQLTELLVGLDKLEEKAFKTRQEKINVVLQLARSLNLPETDDRMAKIVVGAMNRFFPNIPISLAKTFEQNKSEVLLPMARRIATDNTYNSYDILELKGYILQDYYIKVQPKEGVRVCREVIRRSTEGYHRFICARTLVKLVDGKGIEYTFEDLPDEVEKLAIPEDHPFVSYYDLNVETFAWDEVIRFCGWLKKPENADLGDAIPYDQLRGYMSKEDTPLTKKVASMHCLATLAQPEDLNALKEMAEDRDAKKVSIEGYGLEQTNLAELANALITETEGEGEENEKED